MQNHFSIPPDVHYLNCATMSPLPKAVEEAGIRGLLQKSKPYEITADDFFETAEKVKANFAKLINCENPQDIAIMPSTSYGFAVVVKNLKEKAKTKKKIVLLGGEFPSVVFAWKELNIKIETIDPPKIFENRGEIWNENFLEAINNQTLLVCLSPTHWADGTLFDLEKISKKCKENDVLLLIDGTQHIGAFPFDVQQIKPDFVITATYKWLLGPYGTALAYCGDFLKNGLPLEESWKNRLNSNDFKNLIHYENEYRPDAFRYNVGEMGNFIQLPMINKSLELLLEWTPQLIQNHAKNLLQNLIKELQHNGFWIEAERFRSNHLFGIKLPKNFDLEKLQKALSEKKVYLSFRGDFLRISVHLWNNQEDITVLRSILLDK